MIIIILQLVVNGQNIANGQIAQKLVEEASESQSGKCCKKPFMEAKNVTENPKKQKIAI